MEKLKEKLKERIERKRTVKFWGQTSEGNDVFCEEHIGDGKSLLEITTISSRPWSYYLLVDSKFECENDEQMEEALQTLEEHYGIAQEVEDDEECDEYNNDNPVPFPYVDTSYGYAFGVVDLEEMLNAYIN